MIVQSHITQCHANFVPLSTPLKNVMIKEGLIDHDPLVLRHYDDRRHFNNGFLSQVLSGKYAPALFRGAGNK
jgi:hypothetical protein